MSQVPDNDNALWTERWRPQCIEDCVLPKDQKKMFADIVKSGNLPNMILAGSAGIGKTTIARALCKELNLDYLMINASEESGIDVLRNKIKQYASSMSMTSDYKVIILDEADNLNPQSTQPALRAFIEEFHKNCRFILTCNFKNKIIEPLHSRCVPITFGVTSTDEKRVLCATFFKRMSSILTSEGVQFDKQVLAEIVARSAPDWRRVINECQRYSKSGVLETGIVSDAAHAQSMTQLIGFLRDKEFTKMRKWVASNTELDGNAAMRMLYDRLADHAEAATIPNAVLIIAEYMYKSSFCADKEINLVACMTELMGNIKWKK